ncbi:uroporphyrinogen-III C-methyltransferase [Phenylobacterium sp.]|uniref:uroporphyrinogen-III C-methyltransferase n=1 Tax=Phenylobacterium sp. TaxID=1871053 RepID=UPI0035AD7CDD
MSRVLLVSAGPGAPGLMTVRAAEAVRTAEALLYDALVCDEAVALAPERCIRIRTGKRSGKASMKQETINRLMLRLARRGLTVVRLKGGDASVFGRSGEERAFLEANGVAVEIVPGVTAASAAAAQFGFPLTHRGEARRLMLATARTRDGALADGGWREAADPETTVALYMAGASAAAVAERLMAEGRRPATPALAVENAGRPEARLVRTDLAGLPAAVAAAAFEGPVLLLVGEVAAQAKDQSPRTVPIPVGRLAGQGA